MARGFPPPQSGDIVWCRFPHRGALVPGPKPRPALVIDIGESTGRLPVHASLAELAVLSAGIDGLVINICEPLTSVADVKRRFMKKKQKK